MRHRFQKWMAARRKGKRHMPRETVYYEELDMRVADWCRRNGYTKERFAHEVMGMSPNTLMYKLRGDTEFTLTEARRIAELLDAPLDELAGRSTPPN